MCCPGLSLLTASSPPHSPGCSRLRPKPIPAPSTQDNFSYLPLSEENTAFTFYPLFHCQELTKRHKTKANSSASNHILQAPGCPDGGSAILSPGCPTLWHLRASPCTGLPSSRSTQLKCCQLSRVLSPGSFPFPGLLATCHLYHQTSSKCGCSPVHTLLNHLLGGFCGSPTKTRSPSVSRSTATLPASSVNFLRHTIQSPAHEIVLPMSIMDLPTLILK